MIVRKIKPEELKRTYELFAVAFEVGYDNERSAAEVYSETISSPETRADIYCGERWAAFEDDDRTMMSCFAAYPYTINFDRNPCAMAGIGGVSSLPQYRRMGGIRACFEAALPAMYEDGMVFSYLFPFSTAYYRKFGYELCCEKARHTIRTEAIRPFTLQGRCFLAEPENLMLEDIRRVYEAWQNRYNMMVVNEDFEYAWARKANPVKDQEFTYVYKAADGAPKGFMTFRKAEAPEGCVMNCSRFFCTDAEGLKGLLNLAYACSADHRYIAFDLPPDQDISPLLPEWAMGACKRERWFNGMARVVNVRAALEMARYKGGGGFVIRVEDPVIPRNNLCFAVEHRNGAAIDVSISETAPDISLSISDFSRLITGAWSGEDAGMMESLRVRSGLAASRVFFPKPCYITEYF